MSSMEQTERTSPRRCICLMVKVYFKQRPGGLNTQAPKTVSVTFCQEGQKHTSILGQSKVTNNIQYSWELFSQKASPSSQFGSPWLHAHSHCVDSHGPATVAMGTCGPALGRPWRQSGLVERWGLSSPADSTGSDPGAWAQEDSREKGKVDSCLLQHLHLTELGGNLDCSWGA